MQKFLWGGAALLVAGAASVYVASDYIVRHPESIVARAGSALSSAAVNSNPLSVVNGATTGTDTVREDDGADVNVSNPLENGETEETIEPIQVEVVPTLPGDLQEVENGNDEDNAWLATIKMGQVPEWTEEWSHSELHDGCNLSSPVEMMVELVRGAREACENAMMACADYEDKPECQKAAKLAAMMDQVNALMHEHKFKEAYALAVRASEMFPESVIAHTAVSMCKMWNHRADKEALQAAESAAPPQDVQVEEIPVMPEEEACDEEAEDTVPLQSEEPSYYHHHYEGCPGMGGGCPYPHSTLEQSPVTIPPCEKPAKVRKPCKPEAPAKADSLSNRTSERRSFAVPFADDRRSFAVPFTDTMEFRPSDAGNYPVLKVGPF